MHYRTSHLCAVSSGVLGGRGGGASGNWWQETRKVFWSVRGEERVTGRGGGGGGHRNGFWGQRTVELVCMSVFADSHRTSQDDCLPPHAFPGASSNKDNQRKVSFNHGQSIGQPAGKGPHYSTLPRLTLASTRGKLHTAGGPADLGSPSELLGTLVVA